MNLKSLKINKRRQSGMSLLEIIIVLGIIGTIAAGVVVLAQRALDNKTVADLNTNLNSVRLAVIETYKTGGYVPGLAAVDTMSGAELEDPANHAANAADPRIAMFRVGAISSSELTNPVSGTLFGLKNQTSVSTATAPTAPAKGKIFSIAVDGLSSSQCAQVLQAQVSQWDYVEVIVDGTNASVASQAMDQAKTAAAGTAGGVIRSLESTSRAIPDITEIADVCSAANNAVVFASR